MASRPDSPVMSESLAAELARYGLAVTAIEEDFARQTHSLDAGSKAIAARSNAVDRLVNVAWQASGSQQEGLAILAVGGYGRRELFPFSDIDLLVVLDLEPAHASAGNAIRALNQSLWDAGLRAAILTRTLAECADFQPANVEFTLALLDARPLAGDAAISRRLVANSMPALLARQAKGITERLVEITLSRHARHGDTLFHLDPNIKQVPGSLRDAHVCAWLERLSSASATASKTPNLTASREFQAARQFLLLTRTFLHLRHRRDDNVLDWHAQDAAAAISLGLAPTPDGTGVNPAYWMRHYFRHARVIERTLEQLLASSGTPPARKANLSGQRLAFAGKGFELRQQRLWLVQSAEHSEPAHDPEVVFDVFAAMARTGARLSGESAAQLEQGLPSLSANLEDGPILWRRLKSVLLGAQAGTALRTMHALGILELIIPEFHGIDALVIRDAYHRYTVDEHTFVLIDTLHGLKSNHEAPRPQQSSQDAKSAGLAPFAERFSQLLRDLPHPELLFLAALLHDTGKGRTVDGHAAESVRMATNVLERLELGSYERALVLDLIRHHLEMSAALRRDVFDRATIVSFGTLVPAPELLRMLTLFTYADIAAVNPDALTPWKAENLWRLYTATAAYLDRSVDEERVQAQEDSDLIEPLHRLHMLLPHQRHRVQTYIEGFPRRYLQTRSPENIVRHLELAAKLQESAGSLQLDFQYAKGVSELALISQDRPRLFANMAGALAAWGMHIITADAFSNAHGVVVDTFRFTDTFHTLELNESERGRFVENVASIVNGTVDLAPLLAARRRGRRPDVKVQVDPRVDFDDHASNQSTLMQVVAQDMSGLLGALAFTLAEHACNIEVALVDTEGETAFDVFYITHKGKKLEVEQKEDLRSAMLEAIQRNTE